MSLSIETDKDVYHGGDSIRGLIVLVSQRSESISSVVISLQGTTKVKLMKDTGTGPRPHLCKQILFTRSTTLGSGDVTLPAGSHTFEFDISIPSQSDRNQPEDILGSAKPFFSTKDRYALPPSFHHSVSELEADFVCCTKYSLEAHIARPNVHAESMKALKSKIKIEYLSARPLLPAEKKMFRETHTAKSLRLLPDKANSRLSMRERVKSTFKSSELPSATFHTVLWIPKTLTKTDICPIRIAVRYGETSAPSHPTIRLRAVRITAHPYVEVRTRSLVGDYRVGHLGVQTLLEMKNLDIALPAGLSDMTAADTDEFELSDLGIDTSQLHINFVTCNICVSTNLEAELQVVCADKKFRVRGSVRLTVLPPLPEQAKSFLPELRF